MNKIVIETLNEKYPNSFTVETGDYGMFVRFPAPFDAFGPVDIYEEKPGDYIVYVGKFTHSHFDMYEGTEEEMAETAVEDIVDFLEKLFSDQVICWSGSQMGGWYLKGYGDKDAVYPDSYVWSGEYESE